MQCFQRTQGLGLELAHLVEKVHASVSHECGDHMAVDLFTHLQSRRHRQLAAAHQSVFQARTREAEHANHHHRGVVLRARGQRCLHDGRTGLLRRALTQQGQHVLLRQAGVHAVGEQHEGVAQVQLALQVVDANGVVLPHRAGQLAAQIGVIKGVILRQPPALRATHQIGPRVAHVGHRPGLAAQGERRQGAHRSTGMAPVVSRQPAVLGTDDAIEHHAGVPGGRCAEIVFDHRHHAGLRCHAPPTAGRDAIGDGSNETQCLFMWRRPLGCSEVFVVLPGATIARVAHVDVKAHKWVGFAPTWGD